MQDLITIKTLAELDNLTEYLKDFEYVSFDTETVGLHKGAEIIGFSVCAEDNVAFYVILSHWCPISEELIELETAQGALSFFEVLKTKKIIGHNIGFDVTKVYDIYKIDLMPSVDTDTLVLAHLLDENRRVGLKDLGATLYGDSAKQEQAEMKASVIQNGGVLTKDKFELYKADADLLAKYGAKDALLTWNLFNSLVPQLTDELYDFFYVKETMPLLKGPTQDLNTTGLKVDQDRLQALRGELEASIAESQAIIAAEIKTYVQDKYPGTTKKNLFNIGSTQQLAWLLFERLGQDFTTLTDGGREVCKKLGLKLPYTAGAKREFIKLVKLHKGQQGIKDPWQYMCTDEDSLAPHAKKYEWVAKLLEQKKNQKMLSTYVIGIQERTEYGIVRPNFKQHGTTSGRYSCNQPNFQNLPRDDKRIKACIVSRPGSVFIGADYSQLEPRVFASVSQDKRLLECFAKGEDFYSVVGAPIFGITDCSMIKDDENSFANKHKQLRNVAKAFALATPYGVTAYRQAQALGKPEAECQSIMDQYFASYPQVELMMLESHVQVKATGVVQSLYGRPRRIPEAMGIAKAYGKNTAHSELPYAARTLLNLAMNHRVQSSAASIVNRAAIAFYARARAVGVEAKIVLQVHDELVVECKDDDSGYVAELLKDCMETTTVLPGVSLIANPVIAKNLADLK